jgi:hypothetical protein
MSDPYRSPPSEPQFVCLVCYRSLSVQAGPCPRCGVDRLPLGDPEVRADVRAEAERRLQKKLYSEWFWSYIVAATAVGLFVAFPLTGGLVGGAIWIALTMVLGSVNVKVYELANPRSALRLYAQRRARLAPHAQKLLPAHAGDPEDAELTRVLALLGARVET